MKRLILISAITLLTLAVSAQSTDGVWVQCKVLQCKLNRFYFDVGEEARVFEGNRAVVLRKKDTVWSGVIERACEGVSISERIAVPPAIKSVTAYVQAAALDSHAVLTIGTAILPALAAAQPAATADSVSIRTRGLVDSVIMKAYADVQSMQLDFQAGRLDGILTYRTDGLADGSVQMESAPAPYIAAIVPRAASILNRQRLLTSSLISRIDTSIARGQFDGSEIRFESRFLSPASDSGWFAFDPERGRRTLRQTVDRATAVRIFTPDRELRKLAGYLADLLARDQITSSPAESERNCDFSLAFIPAGRNPDATLSALLELLGPESSAVTELAPSIEAVTRLLQTSVEATDSVQKHEARESAEAVLINDLGCFPLFRPAIFFVSHKTIRGSIFSSDGELNPAGLVRVHLPGRADGR